MFPNLFYSKMYPVLSGILFRVFFLLTECDLSPSVNMWPAVSREIKMDDIYLDLPFSKSIRDDL